MRQLFSTFRYFFEEAKLQSSLALIGWKFFSSYNMPYSKLGPVQFNYRIFLKISYAICWLECVKICQNRQKLTTTPLRHTFWWPKSSKRCLKDPPHENFQKWPFWNQDCGRPTWYFQKIFLSRDSWDPLLQPIPVTRLSP